MRIIPKPSFSTQSVEKSFLQNQSLEDDDDASLGSDLDPEELAGVKEPQSLKDRKW